MPPAIFSRLGGIKGEIKGDKGDILLFLLRWGFNDDTIAAWQEQQELRWVVFATM
jgi:hypothetical protein